MTEFEAKPIRTPTREVPPEWIDYNGHMNVAYYVMAIDNALDDAFDELLHVPAVFHKLDGQPVEQFRVAGEFPLGSKISTCFHKPHAEKLLPESIDDHSRS